MIHLTRCHQPSGPNLVYAETGRNVTLSIVAGRIIYCDGHFTNVDVHQVHCGLVAASAELQEKPAHDDLALDVPIVQLTRGEDLGAGAGNLLSRRTSNSPLFVERSASVIRLKLNRIYMMRSH